MDEVSVRQLLTDSGVTQVELAEACNCSRAYICQQLSGNGELQVSTIIAAQTLSLRNLRKAGGFAAAGQAALAAAGKTTDEAERARLLRGVELCEDQIAAILKRPGRETITVRVPEGWLGLPGGEIVCDQDGQPIYSVGVAENAGAG